MEREIEIAWAKAFPRGLDALLVCADLPGQHPLVVITHSSLTSFSDQNWRNTLMQRFVRRGAKTSLCWHRLSVKMATRSSGTFRLGLQRWTIF